MWLIKAMASPDSIHFEPVIQDFHETIIFGMKFLQQFLA
jgi:hypothetical protein